MTGENCLLCQIISNKIPSYKIYEDDLCIAILDVNGASPGHSFIIPKNHYPIIEQVPDEEMGHLFTVSNKISGAIFENLKVQGTNIFVRNGIPAGQQVAHFMINVIPRKENDNINLQWPPKQLSEEEMSTIELKLKDQIGSVGVSKQTPQIRKQTTPKPEPILDDEDDYFMNQINRIP
ncbi:HIT family protein [Candidatus Woesearchaeota archaeon]|nr:HIT family protein [Candidatus Woesearchaeota archaeon]